MFVNRGWDRRLRRISRWSGALALLIGLSVPAVAAAPKLSTPTPLVDIGALTSGETAEAEFSLINEGTEPLQILRVQTSCGCTSTSHPQTLAPGAKGILKARLTSNPLWNGRMEKEILVTSNDPEQPTQKLRLAVHMRALFRFTPTNPLVMTYKKGDVVRQVVTVTTASDPTVKVVGIGVTTAETEARVLPAQPTDAPGTTRVEVTVHPPKEGGDVSGFVTLQTSHPKVQTVPITISLLSQDAITVRPPTLYWVGPSTGSQVNSTRVITLMKRSSTFRILEAKTDHPALRAEVRRPQVIASTGPVAPPGGSGGGSESSSYHEITLSYAGGLPKGLTQGKLVITTDDPDSPRLEIPYQVTVD